MAETVTMPKLGFDMAEGTLVRWVKKEGDSVNKGDILAEILVMKNKVILECVDEEALAHSKSWFESLSGERAVHFSDEVLSLEDVLES